jgi:hypothetical protein
MSKWPELSSVARNADRNIDHPLIAVVQDEFLERVDELAVGILRDAVHLEHDTARKDTFDPSIHLHKDIISCCSYTA